jgi:hypothetical protein
MSASWCVSCLSCFVKPLIFCNGQVGAQIRHDIALASIAEAQARSEKTLPSLISDSQSRHDNALVSIAASQARHEEVLPTLLSDADRGMSP